MITLSDVTGIRQKSAVHAPITLSCPPGEIVCILGASGVGKTTLLDTIRGQVNYTGDITFSGSVFSVFQGDNQLFPWYTIKQNFKLAGANDSWINLAKQWNLEHLIDKKPNQLSGGQRQRFVLIRALSMQSNILLCDEPLNHLDSLSSKVIARDFKTSIKKSNRAVLWITHDITEAAILSDQCYVLTSKGLVNINKKDITFDYISKYLAV